MPTHSWGHSTQPTEPLKDGPIGFHASKHHKGFQRALVDAEKEVREKEEVQEEEKNTHGSKHRIGFQHALENAEKEVQEGKVHKGGEKGKTSKHHKGFHSGVAGAVKEEKEKKRHMGFQHAIANAEKEVLNRKRMQEAKAREAAQAREAQVKARDEEIAGAADRDLTEEEVRQKELQEADAEDRRLELENARRLISKRESKKGPFNPFEAVKKGFEDATKASKKGLSKVKKALDDVFNTAGKPIMGPINTMRAELCIRRKPLLGHKPCMKFMTKQCRKESSGKGYCKKFFHMVLDACFRAQEQGSDPEGYCELSESLGSKRDVDEDGVPDITDRFPADRTEWSDMDNDGIGDNVDPDRDGDGLLNENDEFPDDPDRPPIEKGDMDGDGIPDDEDPDIDGDGHDNEADAYPKDPTRWLADSPGPGPAPAPAAEPAEPPAGPAPAAAGPAMTKTIVDLPEQGYGEYYRGKLVKYSDGDDFSADWRSEWPLMDETHTESVVKACENHPKSSWCMRFMAKRGLPINVL